MYHYFYQITAKLNIQQISHEYIVKTIGIFKCLSLSDQYIFDGAKQILDLFFTI